MLITRQQPSFFVHHYVGTVFILFRLIRLTSRYPVGWHYMTKEKLYLFTQDVAIPASVVRYCVSAPKGREALPTYSSPKPSKMDPTILYEDEFCSLTEDFLTIKRYFFPLMKPKVLRVREIRVVHFDEQENAKYPLMRTWGKANNNDVYWAVDFRRCLPGDKAGKSNVIVDIEDGLKKGFTVKDADSFLNSLRVVAPMNVIIVDNLNI